MAAILLEIKAEEAEVENRHRPIPRVHRNRATPLDTQDDELIGQSRLNREAIVYLCHQLNDDLKWPSRKHGSLSVELQILQL